jgi:isocitrate/isopropylmalate dehydrogenase
MVTENMCGDILTDEASVIKITRVAAFSFNWDTHKCFLNQYSRSYHRLQKNIANPVPLILSHALRALNTSFNIMEEGA